MAEKKVPLTFQEISARLHALALPPIDAVVGIATGGIVPAALVAHQLQKPLAYLHISFRAPDNQPLTTVPLVKQPAPQFEAGSHLLLVDDVAVSGKTLATARSALPDVKLTTLVLKGRADFVLFPEIEACVLWPWRLQTEGVQ